MIVVLYPIKFVVNISQLKVHGPISQSGIFSFNWCIITPSSPKISLFQFNESTCFDAWRNCIIAYTLALYLRLQSHRSIRCTLYDLPQMTFKWCSMEAAESHLWQRSNRIANTVYSIILLCDHSLTV